MKKAVKIKILLEAIVVLAVALSFIMPVSAVFANTKTLLKNPSSNERLFTTSGEWTEQSSGFEAVSRGIRYLDAVNQNVAWAIAYDGSGGNAATTDFTRTIDGGTQWTADSVLGPGSYGLGNICGLNETVGYVSLFNQGGDQDSTCGAYKTTDGGVTWAQLGHYPISFANNVIFWNENEGVVLGDLLDGYFEDYTTHDGGVTWVRVPQANYTGLAAQSGEGGWTGVVNVVGDTVIFGTNKGNVYISHDRGDHWFANYSGASTSGTNPGINDIAFKDAMNGIVAHDGGGLYDLFETSDGGVNWAPISYDGSAYSIDMAYVPGTENMYVSTGGAPGYSGASYSLDGGHSWTDYDEMLGIQMLATDFVEGKIGWAGGFNTDASTGGMFKHAPGVPHPAFTIDIAGGKGITVKVTNVGEANATNVKCNITITGGLFINPKEFSGTKTTLLINQNFTVLGAPKGIGLGIIKPKPVIKVVVTCDEGVTATETVEAKIFFSKVTLQ